MFPLCGCIIRHDASLENLEKPSINIIESKSLKYMLGFRAERLASYVELKKKFHDVRMQSIDVGLKSRNVHVHSKMRCCPLSMGSAAGIQVHGAGVRDSNIWQG